jgi:hypothetical protein
MRPEQDILRAFANELARRICTRAIRELQAIKDTWSGDDSPLANFWDEFCVQLQDEQFTTWDTFEDMAFDVIYRHVAKLKEHEQLALWFQTEEGWEWINYDMDDKEDEPPLGLDDVARYILVEHLHRKAENWTNKRIESYLWKDY